MVLVAILPRTLQETAARKRVQAADSVLVAWYPGIHTSFALGPVQLKPGQPEVASALVTNTGTRAGEEIVQL